MRWLVPLVLLAVLGCRTAEVKAIDKKCDAPLRLAVENAARTGSNDTLWVIGRTKGTIDEARGAQLAKAGARVLTMAGDIFSARIPPASVGPVALLDFVSQLRLSQESKPLTDPK